ncbi:Flp family type IVb pilin [Kitasatospora indigofera]|uniref:Flp family type IVb pilin n=1 Tax=Kitasatospora indigofera TaxID=67307 RepID=UPI003688682D
MKFITDIQARINSMRSTDDGATAVEYGLMVSLIAVAIIIAVGALGASLSGMFVDVETAIDPAP